MEYAIQNWDDIVKTNTYNERLKEIMRSGSLHGRQLEVLVELLGQLSGKPPA